MMLKELVRFSATVDFSLVTLCTVEFEGCSPKKNSTCSGFKKKTKELVRFSTYGAR